MSFKQLLSKSVTGSVLIVAAGLSFFVTCMLLPLVARAGSSVSYAAKNQLTFLSVLTFTFVLAGLAFWSKMLRRAEDDSPFPFWSAGLCVVSVLLFVLQVSGFLAT